MSTSKVILEDTAVAASDLSSNQFYLVKLTTTGLALAGAGDKAFVLQDKPTAGKNGTYALLGIVKVILGGTVAAGDYLSSDAAGKAVLATATAVPTGTGYTAGTQGTKIVGQALQAGVAGDIISAVTGNGLG